MASKKTSTLLVILIALITVINYFDRTAFSYTIIPIEEQLGLNNSQFGTAAGCFGIGYFLITLFAGVIVDRFGAAIVWGVSAVVWSLITMMMGAATGFFSLSGLLLFLGIAEGFNSPALLRSISDWLDPKWRARALSLSLLGVPLASLIGGPFMTYLIAQLGWRAMFVIVGSLGLVWTIFWFSFFRHRKIPDYPTQRPTFTPWKELFMKKGFWANAFTFFTFGCIVFFVIIWLPGYLQQTYGIAIRNTGHLVVFPWLMAALMQTLGGWMIDAIWKRTQSARKSRVYIVCIGLLGASLSFWFLAFSSSLYESIFFMSLGLGFTFMFNPAIYALNADLFPTHVATAQSLSTCSFALAGFVSPALTGWITHHSGSYEGAIVFIAILPLIACLNALLFCHLEKKA